jgi:GntR family transcriptional regulator, transcriptional repressor for pyruvate dehydrogenase complex
MGTSTSRARRQFSPLKSVRKSDEVYEQLAGLIRGGRFPPGARLPAERELAERLNTSRQTIREALYRAELVGLIEVRHGAGSFVVSQAPRGPIDARVVDLMAEQADRIAESFEIRRLVEGWCAAHAAKTATSADLNTLRQKLARMRALELTDPEWEPNDVEFHVAIARATQNPLAVRMIEILRESFSALYRLKSVIPNKEEKDLIWRHHRDIYDAIRKRSPEKARAAIVAHMDYVQRSLEASLRGITP